MNFGTLEEAQAAVEQLAIQTGGNWQPTLPKGIISYFGQNPNEVQEVHFFRNSDNTWRYELGVRRGATSPGDI